MKVEVGFEVTEQDFTNWFQQKVVRVESDKWFLPDFFKFQYGETKDGFKAKESARKVIIGYGFEINAKGEVGFGSVPNSIEHLPNTSVESMDCPSIGIGIGIGKKGSVRENKTQIPEFDFESLYQLYPRHEGKELGMKRLRSRIKSQSDYDLFAAAVRNYKSKTANTPPDKIKHWSSFIGADDVQPWRDYALKTASQQAEVVPKEWHPELQIFKAALNQFSIRQEKEAAEYLGAIRWRVISYLDGWTAFSQMGSGQRVDLQIYKAMKTVYASTEAHESKQLGEAV